MNPPINKTWLKDAVIYQLFTGRWPTASILHHRKKVFHKLQSHDFSKLYKSGINCIYLLGVHDNRGPLMVGVERGKDLTNESNRMPSPFAIIDHTKTNPYLGTISELKKLIKILHNKGFKVLLDFVPNHTSTYHPWVHLHPDYYYKNEMEHVAEFSGDVYKLNYQNEQLRKEMTTVIDTIARWGADGIRCDMAHLVPTDFWHQAITEIKNKYPHFVFIGESYTNSLFDLSIITDQINAGFNSVYHEPFYRNLRNLYEQGGSLDAVVSHLAYIIKDFPNKNLTNYIANHDDPLPNGGLRHLEGLLAIILFLPGTPLIYNGLLNNFGGRLGHHHYEELEKKYLETRKIPSPTKKLIKLKKNSNPIITAIYNNNGLLTLTLKSAKWQGTMFCNLSDTHQGLTVPHPSSKGLIHDLHEKDVLSPGSAEVFIS